MSTSSQLAVLARRGRTPGGAETPLVRPGRRAAGGALVLPGLLRGNKLHRAALEAPGGGMRVAQSSSCSQLDAAADVDWVTSASAETFNTSPNREGQVRPMRHETRDRGGRFTAERPWLNRALGAGRQPAAVAAQKPAESETDPPAGSGAATPSERLIAAATARIPAALAGRLTGDNLDEVTEDAHRLREVLASAQAEAAGAGEQDPADGRPWLNQLLRPQAAPADAQETEAAPTTGGGFDSHAGGDGAPRSGTRMFDDALRAHLGR